VESKQKKSLPKIAKNSLLHPWGITLPMCNKFTPRGQSSPWGQISPLMASTRNKFQTHLMAKLFGLESDVRQKLRICKKSKKGRDIFSGDQQQINQREIEFFSAKNLFSSSTFKDRFIGRDTSSIFFKFKFQKRRAHCRAHRHAHCHAHRHALPLPNTFAMSRINLEEIKAGRLRLPCFEDYRTK
jgi:hypothetical protein